MAGFGSKYSNPAAAVLNHGTDVAFHPSGNTLAVTNGSTPYVAAYAWGPGFGLKYANPSTLPAASKTVAFNAAGDNIFVGHILSPYINAYPWSSGFGVKYANPGTLMGGAAHHVATNPVSGEVAIAHWGLPKVTVYSWSSGFGSKFSDPSPPLPSSGHGHGVDFSPDGKAIAVGHFDSPYVSVYPWSVAGFGVKFSNPATLPAFTGSSVAFSPAGDALAVAHAGSPYVTVYPWSSGGFGVKYSNPDTLPTSNGENVAFNSTNSAIALTTSGTPFIHAYQWLPGFGTKYANPATLPAGSGNGVAFSPADDSIVMGHSNPPHVAAYGWTTSDPDPTHAEISNLTFYQILNVVDGNSYDAGTGDDRFLVAGLADGYGNGLPINGVTYGGQAMTPVAATVGSSWGGVRLFYLTNPPAGVNEFSYNLGDDSEFVSWAFILNNIDKSNPVGTHAGATGNVFPPIATANVPQTRAGNRVIGIVAGLGVEDGNFSPFNNTEIVQQTATGSYIAGLLTKSTTGGGTTPLSAQINWEADPSADFALTAVEFRRKETFEVSLYDEVSITEWQDDNFAFKLLGFHTLTPDLERYEFDDVDLGYEQANRYIIIATASRQSGIGDGAHDIMIESNGISTRLDPVIIRATAVTNTSSVGLSYARIPQGITGKVIVHFHESQVRCTVAVYRAFGPVSDDKKASWTSNPSVSLNIPAGGFAIAVSTTAANSGSTWTGLPEDYSVGLEGFQRITGASQSFSTAQTGRVIQSTFTNNTEVALVAASFSIKPTPILSTHYPHDIDHESFNASAEVQFGNPLLSRGFVYGQTSHNDPGDVAPGSTAYTGFVVESGSFSDTNFIMPVTGLESDKEYYIRAFGQNAEGYSYGDERVVRVSRSPRISYQVFVGGSDSALPTEVEGFNSLTGGGSSSTWTPSELWRASLIPASGKIMRARVTLSGPPGDGSYTFRVRSIPPGGSGVGVDIGTISGNETSLTWTGELNITRGQYITLRVTPSGAPTPRSARWSVDFLNSEPNRFVITGGTGGGITPESGVASYNFPSGGYSWLSSWGLANNLTFSGRLRRFSFSLSGAVPTGVQYEAFVVRSGVELPAKIILNEGERTGEIELNNPLTPAPGTSLANISIGVRPISLGGEIPSRFATWGLLVEPYDTDFWILGTGNFTTSRTQTQYSPINPAAAPAWSTSESPRLLHSGRSLQYLGGFMSNNSPPGAGASREWRVRVNSETLGSPVVLTDPYSGALLFGGPTLAAETDHEMSIMSIPTNNPAATGGWWVLAFNAEESNDFFTTVNETIFVSENTNRDQVIFPIDLEVFTVVSTTEATVRDVGTSVAIVENLSSTDNAASSRTAILVQGDTVSTVEQLSTSLLRQRSVFDARTITESITRSLANDIAALSALSIQESISRRVTHAVQIVDALVISEEPQASQDPTLTRGEDLSIQENISTDLEFKVAVEELVFVTDSWGAALSQLAFLWDELEIAELDEEALTLFVITTDTITLTEDRSQEQEAQLSFTDAVTITESRFVSLSTFASLYELLPLQEDYSAQFIQLGYAADPVGISELVQVKADIYLEVVEAISLTELVFNGTEANFSMQFSSHVGVSDAVTTSLEAAVAVYDEVTIESPDPTALVVIVAFLWELLPIGETTRRETYSQHLATDFISLNETVASSRAFSVDLNIYDTVAITEPVASSMEAWAELVESILLEEGVDPALFYTTPTLVDTLAISEESGGETFSFGFQWPESRGRGSVATKARPHGTI